MAKFNIEVNLEWLGEDGDIDSILKESIVNSIVDKISGTAVKDIEDKVNTLVDSAVNKAVGDKLNETLEDFLHKPRNITDRWGEITRRNTSVMELLKSQFDDYLEGKVDRDGRPYTGYSDSKKRIDYILEKTIDGPMKKSVETAAGEIKKKLQEYIDTTLKAQIGDNVAKIIGLDSIVKKI